MARTLKPSQNFATLCYFAVALYDFIYVHNVNKISVQHGKFQSFRGRFCCLVCYVIKYTADVFVLN